MLYSQQPFFYFTWERDNIFYPKYYDGRLPWGHRKFTILKFQLIPYIFVEEKYDRKTVKRLLTIKISHKNSMRKWDGNTGQEYKIVM